MGLVGSPVSSGIGGATSPQHWRAHTTDGLSGRHRGHESAGGTATLHSTAGPSIYRVYNITKGDPFRTKVYSANLYDELVDVAADSQSIGGASGAYSQHQRSGTTLNSSSASKRYHYAAALAAAKTLKEAERAKRDRRYQLYKEDMRRKESDSKRLLQEQLADRVIAKEKRFQSLYSDVMEGHRFVEHLDKVIGLADAAERNKKMKQYEEWHKNVYEVVQANICEQIDAIGYRELNARNRQYMQEFVDATNRKEAIFRDIIIESDYDPLKANRNRINAKPAPGTLRDPCSRVLEKYAEEKNMLEDGSYKPVKPGRPSLDTKLWATGVIEDTPHGFFAKIMAKDAKDAQRAAGGAAGGQAAKKVNNTWASSLVMDHYNYAKGRDVVTKEFPRGKKTYAHGDDHIDMPRDGTPPVLGGDD